MMDLGSFFPELKRRNVITESRNLGILPDLWHPARHGLRSCESWGDG